MDGWLDTRMDTRGGGMTAFSRAVGRHTWRTKGHPGMHCGMVDRLPPCCQLWMLRGACELQAPGLRGAACELQAPGGT
eukprot:363749-Chlamydomonas_euryale.AAC.5